LLLGTGALVLISWGCAQSTGARALPPLPPGVTAVVTDLTYSVTGTTVPEISLSLGRAAAKALGGRGVGLHTSRLGVSYQWEQQEVYCKITSVFIELESSIQVPRWTDRGAADFTLIVMWNRYVTALLDHEYTHREYLYRRATDLTRELYRIESPTCSSIQAMARSTETRIRDQYRRLNEQFDEETRGYIGWPPSQEPPEQRRRAGLQPAS